MERTPVSSSSILSVGYAVASETLEIEFKSGLVYQYFNVPQVMYEQLMAASSIGGFFNAHIRNAYPYQQA